MLSARQIERKARWGETWAASYLFPEAKVVSAKGDNEAPAY
jgi:hypothetical protein